MMEFKVTHFFLTFPNKIYLFSINIPVYFIKDLLQQVKYLARIKNRSAKSDIQALRQDVLEQVWNGKGEAEKVWKLKKKMHL